MDISTLFVGKGRYCHHFTTKFDFWWFSLLNW